MKLLKLIILFLLTAPVWAQTHTSPIMDVGVDASKPASCNQPYFYLANDTNILYMCNNKSLQAVSSGVITNPLVTPGPLIVSPNSSAGSTISLLPQTNCLGPVGSTNQISAWTDANGQDWPMFQDGTTRDCQTMVTAKTQAQGYSDGQILTYNAANKDFEPSNTTITTSGTITASEDTGNVNFDNIRFKSLCAAFAYVAANPATAGGITRSRIYDFNRYEVFSKQPWTDSTCGNWTGATSPTPSVYLGNGAFVNAIGDTLHLVPGGELYLQGRAAETAISSTNGCQSANPVACVGTLIIAYNTASPFTGQYAMNCPAGQVCTVLPNNKAVIDFGSTGVAFGAFIQGPGDVSCAGISGSIGVQNTSAQEQAYIDTLGVVGCQAIGVDWEGANTQNSYVTGLEILSGNLTGGTIGTPSTFECLKINANSPNRDFKESTCNPRGTATTGPINVAIQVINSRGGEIAHWHIENSNYWVVVDGSSNVRIDNINAAAASQDASTPVTAVKICAAASTSPCSSGNNSTNTIVTGMQRTAPNITTNAVVDDVHGVTIPWANWTGHYGFDVPKGASLTTTAATSDNVSIIGISSTAVCSLTPANLSAATNIATTYVSAVTTNQITVTHTATASMIYNILCTPY